MIVLITYANPLANNSLQGGSEDVMLDLATRQLYKNYQRSAKANL
jgi:hypothetical protein